MRLGELERNRGAAVAADWQRLCLNCGVPVADRPRGCRGAHCKNCGHPYPLGDCSS